MHVALVTETWPPEINGVALTVHSLATGLNSLGHRVEVVRPRQSDEEAMEGPAGIEQVLVRGAALPRYPGLRFGLPARHTLLRRWRMERPDAIYVATEGPLGVSAMTIAHRLGIPACTGFHTRFDDFVRHYGLGFLTPAVFAWLRRFHNRAAATLVPTEELAQFLRRHRFRNVRLLHRAVDTRLFDPQRRDEALRAHWGLTPDQLAVVHVGRIAPEKNLDLLVDAFRAIQRQRADARLILVGDGPARAGLAQQHPDIVFCGLHRGEDLARHYASGDLFLFPSITETFGNVTLEAMASGLAVVAYDYGAARERIADGRTGVRVPFDDAEAFIAASTALAVDGETRRLMGRSARTAVEGLNPASVTNRFVELLSDLSLRAA
ncbi:glycosyltransferase family 4 protein [Dokdonella koreensis]|jgi:glycosyltransferase involved in cell wall biosynthesis|uniref:Glycosyltransferase n=1 Tax=Dokdonella koreensis DS-123 TaxID=1300342 RepID=A0A160DVJ4_9GAMM|nr:glycosyltransferase family 1 protein [Dokdonella koreensis]ANB18578.1 Glycosyltransferase [Dokdonella koreensis DS-123]